MGVTCRAANPDTRARCLDSVFSGDDETEPVATGWVDQDLPILTTLPAARGTQKKTPNESGAHGPLTPRVACLFGIGPRHPLEGTINTRRIGTATI